MTHANVFTSKYSFGVGEQCFILEFFHVYIPPYYKLSKWEGAFFTVFTGYAYADVFLLILWAFLLIPQRIKATTKNSADMTAKT